MLLYSIKSEIRALLTLTRQVVSEKVRTKFFTKISAEHFHHPACNAAFRRLQVLVRKYATLVTWEELVDDPVIEEDFRDILSSTDEVSLEDNVSVGRLLERLEDYRKVRIVFYAAKNALSALEGDKVDVDSVLDSLAREVTRARMVSEQTPIAVIGKDCTADALIKATLNSKKGLYYTTGFDDYDNVNGGLPLTGVVILAATVSGGKCVVGDTLVSTSRGLFTIAELWNSATSVTATVRKLDCQVCSSNGRANVSTVIRSYGKTKTVTMDSGYSITGLSEHKLWIFDSCSSTFSFVEIGNVKKGMYTVRRLGAELFNDNNVIGNEASSNLADLMLDINDGDYEVSWHKLSHDLAHSFSEWLDFNRASMLDFFSFSKKKKLIVPNIVRTASRACQLAFLSRLFRFSSDGQLGLHSTSYKFLVQLGLMLENFGVCTKIKLITRNKCALYATNVNFTATLLGLNLSSVESVDELPLHSFVEDLFGLMSNELEDSAFGWLSWNVPSVVSFLYVKEILTAYSELVRQGISFSDKVCEKISVLSSLVEYKYSRIVSIDEDKTTDVYDLCVPDTANYLANGIIVHNSTVLLNMLKNLYLLNNISVFKVTLEMDYQQETRRLLSCLSGVPLTKFISGNLSEKERSKIYRIYKKFNAFGKENGCRFSYLSPESAMSMDDLLLTVKPLGYNVIAVDYLTLLSGTDGLDQRLVLSNIVRRCKEYSRTQKCLIILLAQLDEDTSKIRYSRAINEHADAVWTWHYLEQEKRKTNIISINVSKARDGERFSFDVREEFPCMRIHNIELESADESVATEQEFEEMGYEGGVC